MSKATTPIPLQKSNFLPGGDRLQSLANLLSELLTTDLLLTNCGLGLLNNGLVLLLERSAQLLELGIDRQCPLCLALGYIISTSTGDIQFHFICKRQLQ